MIVTAVLVAAVIAQGAYISKTRSQMSALADQVQQLAAESPGELDVPPAPSAGRSWRGSESSSPGTRPGESRGRLSPPRFAPAPTVSAPAPPTAGALPLPPALDSPEARDQLRAFVAAELQRERDDQRERIRQRFEDTQKSRTEALVKSLGLNPDDGRKLTDTLTAAQAARRDLRDKMQSGEGNVADMATQLASLREKTDQQVRQVIGDDKMQKFQELQRQDGGGRGPGGGRARAGWGVPGAAGPPRPQGTP